MYKSIKTEIANLIGKRVSTNSLQFRLTVELIALSVISLTSVTVWAGWRMEQAVVNNHKQMLEYVAMRFPDQVEMYMETGGVKAGIERTLNKVATSELAILVKGDNGEIIAKSANNYDLSTDLQNIGYSKVPTTPQIIKISDRYVVMCGSSLTVNGQEVGKVYLSQDITKDQLQLNSGIYGLIIVSIMATGILILAIALRIRKALSPLQEMSQMASMISIEDLSAAKLQLAKAPDEILG
ncbi:MAG: two-component sensor histidine kinase, partial [Pseudanabaena sp.]